MKQIPQMPELLATEEAARLSESLPGRYEPVVVKELVTNSLDDVSRDLVVLRSSRHGDSAQSC